MTHERRGGYDRRGLLKHGGATAAVLALGGARRTFAQGVRALDVASAGSIHAMLDGSLKTAAAEELRLDLHSHSGGADAVARTIVDGSVAADVFIPIPIMA